MVWKYISFVTSCNFIYFYIHANGVPVLSQNMLNDNFYRINGSVSVKLTVLSLSKIRCASKCNLDDLCDGFQSYVDSFSNIKCVLFNISSTNCNTISDNKTFLKTYLIEKFNERCYNNTGDETTTWTVPAGTEGSELTTAVIEYNAITEDTALTTTDYSKIITGLSTQIFEATTTLDRCSVNAAVLTDNKIWVFIGRHIQIYSSVNDLTLLSFRKEKINSTFSGITSSIDAGYCDGNNIVVVEGQIVHIYDKTTKTVRQATTISHFGYNVSIQAVLFLQDGTKFIFTDDSTVISLSGRDHSTFRLDNNNNANYFKSKNHNERPLNVTAAFDHGTTMYIFSRTTIYTFTKSEATWATVGQIVCN